VKWKNFPPLAVEL